jgi:hypothetical protein
MVHLSEVREFHRRVCAYHGESGKGLSRPYSRHVAMSQGSNGSEPDRSQNSTGTHFRILENFAIMVPHASGHTFSADGCSTSRSVLPWEGTPSGGVGPRPASHLSPGLWPGFHADPRQRPEDKHIIHSTDAGFSFLGFGVYRHVPHSEELRM